jgi:hypothetical protein
MRPRRSLLQALRERAEALVYDDHESQMWDRSVTTRRGSADHFKIGQPLSMLGNSFAYLPPTSSVPRLPVGDSHPLFDFLRLLHSSYSPKSNAS